MRRLCFSCVLILATVCNGDRAWAQLAVRTVALSGQPAPGTSHQFGDLQFSGAELAVNSRGNIAFTGLRAGAHVETDNAEGLWAERNGGLQLIAMGGEPVPGLNAQWFGMGSLVFNAAGHVAFHGGLQGDEITPGSDSSVVWLDAGTPKLIARSGNATPIHGLFHSFNGLALNESGHLIFNGTFVGEDDPDQFEHGVWSTKTGVLAPVLLDGQPLPDGGVVRLHYGFGYAFNEAHEISFSATGPASGTGKADSVIWTNAGGTLRPVLRTGDPAPGTSDTFGHNIRSPRHDLNESGQLVFPFALSSSPSGLSSGIWKNTQPGIQAVAIEDQPIEGTSVRVHNVYHSAEINNSGQTLFEGRVAEDLLDHRNDEAIFTEKDGKLRLVVREGQPAPGINAVFDGANARLNDLGQIVIHARVVGPDTPGAAKIGLWRDSGNGNLELLLLEGQQLSVAENDLRTISSIPGWAISDNGYLAFRATFTDRSSGVFVTRMGVVPTPSSSALSLLAVATLLSNRRVLRR
jgi:hypothetical protein